MRWYVLSEPSGIITLCVDETDARESAAEYDTLYPANAPHVATRLHAIDVNHSEGNLEMVASCAWVQNMDYGDEWATSCGKSFLLNEGSPRENGLQWCGFCGRQLKEETR